MRKRLKAYQANVANEIVLINRSHLLPAMCSTGTGSRSNNPTRHLAVNMRKFWKYSCLSVLMFGIVLATLIYYIFFFNVKKSCGKLFIKSISIRDPATRIVVNDKDCDDGLYVSESFEVLIEYQNDKETATKLLLASSHEFPGSSAPEIKLLSATELLIITKREWVLERGSEQVDGISIKYDFK